MNIEELRTKIDGIDSQLVKLLRERLEIAASIAAYKKERDLPVLDRSRERELLSKVAAQAGKEYEAETRIFFNTLLGLSRSYQSKLMGSSSSYSEKIDVAINSTEKIFPESALVACQGVEGSYSQQACEKLFASPGFMFLNTWEGVFQAVNSRLVPLRRASA